MSEKLRLKSNVFDKLVLILYSNSGFCIGETSLLEICCLMLVFVRISMF